MNYQKLGIALAMAVTDAETLDEEGGAFNVFIHTTRALGINEVTYLEGLGVSCEPADRQVFTATLSARAVDELSEQPWVSSLQLSKKLQLHR